MKKLLPLLLLWSCSKTVDLPAAPEPVKVSASALVVFDNKTATLTIIPVITSGTDLSGLQITGRISYNWYHHNEYQFSTSSVCSFPGWYRHDLYQEVSAGLMPDLNYNDEYYNIRSVRVDTIYIVNSKQLLIRQ